MTSTSWNYKSGVTECTDCDGRGSVWDGKGTGHAFDPDSSDIDCDVCDGQGVHSCDVCGFDQIIDGVDCIVCDTVALMSPAQLKAFNLDSFIEAFKTALEAARADQVRA